MKAYLGYDYVKNSGIFSSNVPFMGRKDSARAQSGKLPIPCGSNAVRKWNMCSRKCLCHSTETVLHFSIFIMNYKQHTCTADNINILTLTLTLIF